MRLERAHCMCPNKAEQQVKDNMKIGQKLILGFLMVALLVAIVGGIGVYQNRQLQKVLETGKSAEETLTISIKNFNILIAAASSAALFLAMILGFFISRSISIPIVKLRNKAAEIGRGNLNTEVEICAKDEVGDLAGSFKTMMENIKREQKETQEAKLYTDSIISSMIDTLIVIKPDGSIKSVNKATCDLLEYTKEELIGSPVEKVFAEKEGLLLKGARLEKFIEEGAVRNFDMTYKTKGGESIPVSFTGSVLRKASCPHRDKAIADCPEFKKKGVHCEEIIGILGVARDMRETRRLIDDLERSKTELQELSKTLEEKVEKRTKTLERSQEAMMNVMDDVRKEKETVEKQTEELIMAHKELESFSKGLEEKVKERTMELSILYEISNAISYTLDYQALLKLIMESLFKIVDYDICASLLYDTATANITLRPAYPESAVFVDEVKNSLIDSTAALTGEDIRKKRLSAFLIPADPNAKAKDGRVFPGLKSFFNVPFIVRGKTIGMINVSSCRDDAFSEDDIKLIYTIANQTSNAIERLQAVITAEKSKMESMVESMAEGVIMVDERGKVVVLNPQARRMLGFEPDEEIISKTLNEKLKLLKLDKPLEESQSKGKTVTKEIVVSNAEGKTTLHSDIAPVKDADGEVIGIVTILRDVTKEREIDRMKTEFISTVSHELRTPLTTMKEFTSIISDEISGKLTKDQKEYIGIIDGNIDRLARLINDLLDISKIESGKEVFKKLAVNIVDIAGGVVSTLNPEAEEKHIKIKTMFSDPELKVYANPDKIAQIFTNLIGNAIRFTKEKGKVTIRIKGTEKEVECSVIDNGVGIASENMGKLFAKFQQFGRTAGAGAKGTGLGLAITKEMIELHNGRIWVESKIGKGSKFYFTLPKYTFECVFLEHINDGIKRAQKKNSKMSLIIASLTSLDKPGKKLSGAVEEIILKDMEDVLRNSLRREEGDIAIRGRSEIAVILADCDMDNALRIEGRFENILEEYLRRQNLTKKIELRLGSATYPDEAKNDKDLVEKAKQA